MAPGHKHHHIVMLPFMAQGHLIPFLALARKIHAISPTFIITIATTPLNIRYLKTSIIPPEIRLFELPFDATAHGLPPTAENTESLSLSEILNLFYATTSLQSPFTDLIGDITAGDGYPPLCVISDVFLGWANEVAANFGTVNVTFSTGGAYGTAAYTALWRDLPQRQADDNGEFTVAGFPGRFHVTRLHRFLRAADGTDSWSRFFQTQIGYCVEKSFGWLCNTAEEIEILGIQILRKYANSPVWPIGPLLPARMLAGKNKNSTTGQHSGRKPGISLEKCVEFLDFHQEKSVLYISFGSQNTISEPQMRALAKGLEESDTAFIWVIRPPLGFDKKCEFRSEWLPEGFEERIKRSKKGLLVKDWAPQPDILCHESTAAFLSHCGWNSVMESLSQGVPLIGWPIAAEQGCNAKMLEEELGVCVEIARGVDSSVDSEHVKSVVRSVVGSEEMRRRAGRIGELIGAAVEEGDGKGSSNEALKEFLAAITGRD